MLKLTHCVQVRITNVRRANVRSRRGLGGTLFIAKSLCWCTANEFDHSVCGCTGGLTGWECGADKETWKIKW